MTQKRGEREASVACKGEHLARSGGYQTNGAAEGHYGNNDRHDCGTSMGASGTKKDLNVRLSSGPMSGVFDVTNAEAKGQDHDEARKTVKQDCPQHALGKHSGGILDFFGFHGFSRCNVLDFGSEDLPMCTAESDPINEDTGPVKPTRQESPMLGQPPLLSNLVKTILAGVLVGARVQSGMRMAKKPQM